MHRLFVLILLSLSCWCWYTVAAFQEVHLENFSPQRVKEFVDFLKGREVLHIPKNFQTDTREDYRYILWPEKGVQVNLHLLWGRNLLIPDFYRKRNWKGLFADDTTFRLFLQIEKQLHKIKPLNEPDDWFRTELENAFSQRQGEPVPQVIKNVVNNLLARVLVLGRDRVRNARASIKRSVEVLYRFGSYGDP